MSAIRVCAIADIECSKGCGNGPCKRDLPTIGLPKMPTLPDASTTIKCNKRRCGWTGLQADLTAAPGQTSTFVKRLGCPTCGGFKFRFEVKS